MTRIGLGWDRHPLGEGRPLLLLGVEIPSPRGPTAHSDGDVLAHAVADAVLGMAGLGDLGGFFPEDAAWTEKMAGSDLLRQAVGAATKAGFKVHQVDAQIRLEDPPLAPYLPEIRARCAAILGVGEGEVRITARHGEGLGTVGRGECLEALVVLLGGRE